MYTAVRRLVYGFKRMLKGGRLREVCPRPGIFHPHCAHKHAETETRKLCGRLPDAVLTLSCGLIRFAHVCCSPSATHTVKLYAYALWPLTSDIVR